MARTFLNVRVRNPENRRKSREYRFLIDSGAVYTVMPARELQRLGIEPSSTERFTLADGESVQYPVGNAYFEYQNMTRAAPVVFGGDDVFLLGVTTIEALGMILDPIRRELKPLPMLLMSANG